MRHAIGFPTLSLLATLAVLTAGASGSIEDIEVTIPAKSVPAELPPVTNPETCSVSACDSPTTVGPVGSPHVFQCDPLGTVCVDVDPIQIVGAQTVPAICSVASAVCIPAGTVLPASGATVATEESKVGVYGIGNTQYPGPIPITLGPVEVTLCATPSSCPVPVVPIARSSGAILVSVHIGESGVSQRIPITVEAEEVLP